MCRPLSLCPFHLATLPFYIMFVLRLPFNVCPFFPHHLFPFPFPLPHCLFVPVPRSPFPYLVYPFIVYPFLISPVLVQPFLVSPFPFWRWPWLGAAGCSAILRLPFTSSLIRFPPFPSLPYPPFLRYPSLAPSPCADCLEVASVDNPPLLR